MGVYLQKQFFGGYWGILFFTLNFLENIKYRKKEKKEKKEIRNKTRKLPN
jgi:hypothetical protein